MRITSGGNVGIGTSSPSVKLDVGGASNTDSTGRFFKTSEGTLLLGGNRSTSNCPFIGSENNYDFAFITNNTERMRIASGGNVGIGITPYANSISKALDMTGGAGMFGYGDANYLTGNSYFDGGWKAKNAGIGSIINVGDNIVFSISNSGSAGGTITMTERMRITSGGNVLIGTTSNVAQKLRVYQPTNGDWNIKLIQTNGSDQKFQEFLTTTDSDATNTARGSITYNGTLVLYTGTSDYRLKEDLRDYNAINIINQLKTYDFKWKESGTRDFGMMAHELQEVLPSYVNGEKDAINEDGSLKTQGVDYSKIVPILVKAIQELELRIKQLENK